MGDYLKIAADKTRGRIAPAIQPRIPSLFEPASMPVSPATPEQQASFATEQSFEPARTQVSEVQKSLPTIPPSDRDALPTTELRQHDRVGNRESKQTPAVLNIRPKNDSLQPTVPGFEDHEEVVTPVVTTPPARGLVKPARPLETEPQTPLRVDPATVKKSAPAPRTDIKEVHSRTVERQLERSVVKEVMERVRQVQTEQSPTRPVRTVPGFHDARTFSSEPVEDSRPVINVVIGRVSVNAVTERPATAPKPKSSGPILSLDRYLEQRREQS